MGNEKKSWQRFSVLLWKGKKWLFWIFSSVSWEVRTLQNNLAFLTNPFRQGWMHDRLTFTFLKALLLALILMLHLKKKLLVTFKVESSGPAYLNKTIDAGYKGNRENTRKTILKEIIDSSGSYIQKYLSNSTLGLRSETNEKSF